MKEILQDIAQRNKLKYESASSLAGGDINEVYLLKCKENEFVVKLNDDQKFPQMFEAESKGLSLLKDSNNFMIPTVVDVGSISGTAYLLMEHIQKGTTTKMFWEIFAAQLSKLHKRTAENFGLDHNNYIGSLPQYNGSCSTASDFYISQRLDPQFSIASEKGFNFRHLNTFLKNIEDEIPKEPPSLVHGDLWGGNFLISANGHPVLIDPAVAFAPREMDIAMMKLFGGFDPVVFDYYCTLFPLQDNWQDRLGLWQLYYLLVHLNLFGPGYLQQVKSIVKKYS